MAGSPPTREQILAVLDDVFRCILEGGEEDRAQREQGETPLWIPSPVEDSLYDGLEMNQWDAIPTEPALEAMEWDHHLLLNRLDPARPLVDAALAARNLPSSGNAGIWHRFLRLALTVVARAYWINVRRDKGDYSDGFPQSTGIPIMAIPGTDMPVEAASTSQRLEVGDLRPHYATTPKKSSPLLSEMFHEFVAEHEYEPKSKGQALGALNKFTTLIGDRPVSEFTGDHVEDFKTELRRLPAGHGKGIYAGKALLESIALAEKLRKLLKTRPGVVSLEGKNGNQMT